MKKIILILSLILTISSQVSSQEFELPENYSLSDALGFLESQGMVPASIDFKRMDISYAINEKDGLVFIYSKELTKPYGNYNYPKGWDRFLNSATWEKPFLATDIIIFKDTEDKKIYLVLQGIMENLIFIPRSLALDFTLFYEGEPHNSYKIPEAERNINLDIFLFYLSGEKEVKGFLKFFNSSQKIMVSYTVEGKKYTVPFIEEDRLYAIEAAKAYLALIKETQKKR